MTYHFDFGSTLTLSVDDMTNQYNFNRVEDILLYLKTNFNKDYWINRELGADSVFSLVTSIFKDGDINVIKALLKLDGIPHSYMKYALETAIEYNHPMVVILMSNIYDIHNISPALICQVAYNGHLGMLELLYDLTGVKYASDGSKIKNLFGHLINGAAAGNQLKVIKWALELDIGKLTQNTVYAAASAGRDNIINWLTKQDIHYCIHAAIGHAAIGKHVSTVQLLNKKLGKNITKKQCLQMLRTTNFYREICC